MLQGGELVFSQLGLASLDLNTAQCPESLERMRGKQSLVRYNIAKNTLFIPNVTCDVCVACKEFIMLTIMCIICTKLCIICWHDVVKRGVLTLVSAIPRYSLSLNILSVIGTLISSCSYRAIQMTLL